jgi:large subunit ribosomal protein L23
MSPFDILISPLLSEKAYQGFSSGRYTFWVHPEANKTQVKNAVEQAFSKEGHRIKVLSVNVQNVRGKHKRVGRFDGFKADRRKAIVQLAEGQKIEALEGLV